MPDLAGIDCTLADGADRARAIAAPILDRTYATMGMVGAWRGQGGHLGAAPPPGVVARMSDMRVGRAATVATPARDGALFMNGTGATDRFGRSSRS
jgi:hypothetical protein